MIELILSNIRKRPTRTVVSVLAVAMGFCMVTLFIALSDGMLNDTAYRTKSIKADILFQPPGSSLLMALNNASLPVKIGERLKAVPGVRYVSPALHQFSKKSFSLVFGVEPVSFNQVSDGGIIIQQGRLFQGGYECIVDDVWAASHPDRKLGDTAEVLNHRFTITGVFKAGIAARILVPLETLQELNDSRNKASIFYLKCDSPQHIDQVYNFLTRDELFKGYHITRGSDIEKAMSANLPGLKEFTMAVVLVACLISFLVILLTMYTTIMERTREIGILKSLGASTGWIVRLILQEAAALSCMGVVAGLGLLGGSILVLKKVSPSLTLDIGAVWIVAAALAAVASGVLGATYPSVRAARLDPVEALMYE